MKTVQVKPGKPAKFYVNNKRVCLNTAFGMYQKGAKFTVNGKKIKLNKFGDLGDGYDDGNDLIYNLPLKAHMASADVADGIYDGTRPAAAVPTAAANEIDKLQRDRLEILENNINDLEDLEGLENQPDTKKKIDDLITKYDGYFNDYDIKPAAVPTAAANEIDEIQKDILKILENNIKDLTKIKNPHYYIKKPGLGDTKKKIGALIERNTVNLNDVRAKYFRGWLEKNRVRRLAGRFGIRNRKKKTKKKKKKQVSNNKTAALNIPSELVEKITLMTYGLNPHPTAKLIKENNLMKKKRKATERWDEDSLEWSGQGRKYIGHPGYNRIDVMNMSSDKIRAIMENIPGPYDNYSGSDSYKTRMRNTMRWSSDDVDWYAPAHPGGRAMSREEVVRMNRSNRDIYMNNLPKDANFWSY